MTQIIGFLGKKQSGKNTCCNFIYGLKMKELGACSDFRINDEGQIEITDILGHKPERKSSGKEITEYMDWFPFTYDYVNVPQLEEDLTPHVKIYALADPLKQIAIDVLGLEKENVYGSDKQKNLKCDIRWENMPGVLCSEQAINIKEEIITNGNGISKIMEQANLHAHEPGKMKVREVLQYLGTEVFRRIDPNVWVHTLLRRIERDKPEIALVCDVRFDNEVRVLKRHGGCIIGLRRDDEKKKDKHASEAVDLKLATKIVKNEDISIDLLCNRVYKAVKNLPHIPELEAVFA